MQCKTSRFGAFKQSATGCQDWLEISLTELKKGCNWAQGRSNSEAISLQKNGTPKSIMRKGKWFPKLFCSRSGHFCLWKDVVYGLHSSVHSEPVMTWPQFTWQNVKFMKMKEYRIKTGFQPVQCAVHSSNKEKCVTILTWLKLAVMKLKFRWRRRCAFLFDLRFQGYQ